MSDFVFPIIHEVPLVTRAMIMTLVEAIPNELKVVFGTLVRGDVSSYDKYPTEWVFGSCISQTVKSKDPSKSDIFNMLVGKQDPHAVLFGDGAFGYCEVLPVQQSKRFISHFLQKEYWGRLTFAQFHGDDWGLHYTIVIPQPNKQSEPFLRMGGVNIVDHDCLLAPVTNLCERLGLQYGPPVTK